MTKSLLWAGVILAVAVGTVSPVAHAEPAVPVVEPVVLEEIAHDPEAFTQGFEISGGVLYEGTGQAGQSQMRTLDPDTGEVTRAVDIPGDYFGEGITVVGDRIWQLTYRDEVAVEWDRAALTPVREVPVPGEGWGLCYDGERLIRSDGTNRLTFHDPNDFTETGGVDVTRDGRALNGLNELECVDGQVWANLWPSDNIVRIDPASGAVDLVVNAAGLRARGIPPSAQVLNGIAHVGGSQFLLTGKDWPKTFRVQMSG
ncbi:MULTISPECIES: glutaminyl-peptide cyclotransferase [Mycolicibacterium]|jgi:glutamine cyclotransferase|uniref:Glutaminyl-peptide cyclotransferase n=1 Tax=Mycolicibacterium austroafricanum TaxID=39687 RepID=A0ABT8HES6_MYCAO|nr:MULTISPECIES: glutaminyl-peptide cyclotransferase [Mycolicibacterium]MDN4519270.1 glutaminyl-peptide cyclotransferase [Mycolicibacterium austroafricanum]MDW5609483.1 glutaminyl-peptide cyclotransferase [Mycolicibacterium sp. D5.8-2]PQP48968.1 glutaminyl-peptide cyclotransferase [Mycolicibacterium austroafricanum]QRZ06811.1 glutaminyl-peptide cyclotransferase [Mycolicibacterium austroafricanum]QZT56904.1 glutaminyl-peptide cyclotransferase [Mycolicibacterium austroafricanum]